MKKSLLLIFLLLAINIYGQSFYHPESVVQGGPVTFVITTVEGNIDFTFSLYNDNGVKVLSVEGFNYYLYNEKLSIILGIGGIPVDLPVGRYKLKADGFGIIDTFFFERYIEVVEESFQEMTLAANNKMDSIINGKRDPDRDAQSQRLWDAISSFSPYILYEEDILTQPIEGRHTSPFGFKRITEYPSGKESSSYHKGEDLAAPIGTAVLSDGAGRVILAEKRIVTGNTVVVEHLPGVKTLYYHMDSINVNRGDVVLRGSKIGEVGTTGYSTGPHLHWELRIATVPVDPKIFLKTPLIDKTLILDMINNTNNKRGG